MKRHSPRLAKKPQKFARTDPSPQSTSKESPSNKPGGKHTATTEREPVEDNLLALEQDALNAFKNNDEASFTNILSKTSSLLVRDKGVMLATQKGWTQAVRSLLITNPPSSEYPRGVGRNDILMHYYFTQLVPEKVPGSCDPRWLIQKALLESIKLKHYDILKMLLPVVGVDFVDNNFEDPFSYAFRYCTEIHELKQFLRLLISKISPRTPPEIIARYLIDLSYTKDTELMPVLFKKLFLKHKDDLIGPEVALKNSIHEGESKMVKCLIEQLEKFLPNYNNQINLYVAVEAEKLSILQYLIQHHHNSYALKEYGVQNARVLADFLQKANAKELYGKIISSNWNSQQIVVTCV